jgi:deoxycytidine triphosphate deaminase
VARERIVMVDGFVGTFFPASRWIEYGLLFTMGRLDAHYEREIAFGVYNASRSPVRLTAAEAIARISFTWTGSDNFTHPKGSNAEPYGHAAKFRRLLVGGDEWSSDTFKDRRGGGRGGAA